jgi:hypothetical protein
MIALKLALPGERNSKVISFEFSVFSFQKCPSYSRPMLDLAENSKLKTD